MLLSDIRRVTQDAAVLDTTSLPGPQRALLESATAELTEKIALLDPVRHPGAVFDPSDSGFFGVFAAIALIGQDFQPLKDVASDKIYGSGVYAIYYTGDFDTYAPIRDTETPIYVGKADPNAHARTPREQGTKLTGRLTEHQKNIDKAENLSIDDFRCRRLVIASGWQGAAEGALIRLFNPVWNKETKVLQGFGKHGDSSETRANSRSPWDTLHPGRIWARASNLVDAKSPDTIRLAVAQHFQANPPLTDSHDIIQQLISRVGVGQT